MRTFDGSDTESLSDVGGGYGGDGDDIVSIHSELESDNDDGEEEDFASFSSQFGNDSSDSAEEDEDIVCIDVSDTESLSDVGDGYGGDDDDDIVSIYSESEGDSDDGDEDIFESASQFGSDSSDAVDEESD